MLIQEVQSVSKQLLSDTGTGTGNETGNGTGAGAGTGNGTCAGQVVRTGPGVYLVRSGDRIWDCRLRGRLRAKRERLSDISVCVGDYVLLDKMQSTRPGSGNGNPVGGNLNTGYGGNAEIAGTALISEILPRRTSLSRLAPLPWPGASPIAQILAVNIDLVVVVVAAVAPPLKMTTIDRFLLLARQAGIEPAVCINKVDQAGIDMLNQVGTDPTAGQARVGVSTAPASDECHSGSSRGPSPTGESGRGPSSGIDGGGESLLRAREAVLSVKTSLEARGVTTLLASASAGQGIDELRALLRGKTSVFVGHSGVGKTSILKRICPGLDGKTLSVNVVTGKGRHSTTFSSLIDIGGGYVADLPGLRSIGFWNLEEETVKSEFEDVEEIAVRCRFNDCSHTHEPGCAVKRAVESGELDEARYQEYLKVMREASATRKRKRPGP